MTAPTLLIVGGNDDVVIELNQRAYEQLRCEKDFQIVPRASHLFEEPGTLETWPTSLRAGSADTWLTGAPIPFGDPRVLNFSR